MHRVLAIAVLLFAAPAWAGTERVSLLRLEIAGSAAGEVLVTFDEDGVAWVAVDALGANVPAYVSRATREGVPSVRLSDLGAELDESAGVVRLRPPDAVSNAPERVAVVRLAIDGADHGDTLLVRQDGEWWLALDGLPREIIGRPREIGGVRSLSLSSIVTPWSAQLDVEGGRLVLSRAGVAPAVAAAPADSGVFLVRVELDGVPRGETIVVHRDGERWVAADLLSALGLRASRRPAAVDGTQSVPLSTLSGGATAFVDDAVGVLRIVTTPVHESVALVDVLLNRDAKGEALVVRRAGEMWVSVESLLLLGVGGFEGQRASIDGVRCVGLGSLSPLVVYRSEPGRLHLSVAPELLRGRDQAAVLELVVNEEKRGEVLARIGGGSILVPVATLEQAGVTGFEGRRSVIEGTEHVELGSLAPRVTHVFDEDELTLRITAEAMLLANAVHRDLAPDAPRDIVYTKNTSFFVNYGLSLADQLPARGEDGASAQQAGEAPRVSGSIETALNVRGALAASTFSRTPDGRLSRGLSAVTLDDRRRRVRWSGGDAWVDSGALGGGAVLAGVSTMRVFELDPYAPVRPSLDLSGVAATPSTVEVWVNDRLVHREQLPAGRFELENVRAETGAGNARIVVRDAFGREQTVRDPYYIAREALAPGTHEFAYGAGLVRRTSVVPDATWDPGEYGEEPTFIARHRMGLFRWLGAGLRLEASETFASGGPAITLGMPVGQLELAFAASRDGEAAGTAAAGAWNWSGRRFGLGASARVLSPDYATVSTRAAADRALLDARVFATARVGRLGSITLQQAHIDRRDGEDSVRTSASGAFRVFRSSSLFVSASQVERPEGGETTHEVFAGLSVSFGGAGSAQVNHSLSASGMTTGATAQRSLPAGSGFGYRVSVAQDTPAAQPGTPAASATRPPPHGDGTVQYQSRYGRWEAGAASFGEQAAWHASAAGSLIAVGGGVFASRPVEQGFALVEVPGVAGVRVYAANQEIARTNRRGRALVPNLLSYYGNRISIADTDIPLRYSIEETRATIAPPSRGGAVVTFLVRRITAVSGRIALGDVVPVWGELRIGKGADAVSSPIGKNGEFFFEDLRPGKHRCEVRWRGKTWAFMLNVPDRPGDAPVTDVGRIRLRAKKP